MSNPPNSISCKSIYYPRSPASKNLHNYIRNVKDDKKHECLAGFEAVY